MKIEESLQVYKVEQKQAQTENPLVNFVANNFNLKSISSSNQSLL